MRIQQKQTNKSTNLQINYQLKGHSKKNAHRIVNRIDKCVDINLVQPRLTFFSRIFYFVQTNPGNSSKGGGIYYRTEPMKRGGGVLIRRGVLKNNMLMTALYL